MSLRRFRNLSAAVLLSTAALATASRGQLQVTYGSKGVQTLSYNGVMLENTQTFSADSFHIWHMKATDLNGNVLQGGQTGWGEINNGSTWNAQTLTETYNFSWGSISTQFVQNGDTLNMVVTETNYAGSGILFDGAEIYPFALHFPQDPNGFNGYTQYAITSTDPGISIADFGSGRVTAVLPDESKPLYTGWKNQGAATYSPIMTSTYPDGIPTFFPHNDLPLAPGNTLTYTLSLRFTPEGTAANTSDATASFARTYPSQLTWADKRLIGTSYLASSPTSNGDKTQPGGFPTNPRRYFNDASVDVTSAAGLRSFQNRMLTQAANQVANAKLLNAQGVITWDIEGEQYPQDTSYVCSPDQIGAVAPEMESTITDPSSAFYGQKLDDAYFKTMTNAGLRVGLCLRPQVFTLGANGTASQQFLSTNAAIIANLENKARVAYSRWGATLFYVDSTVDVNGGTLDPAIFQQVSTDLPNFLFVPEESNTRYYAYTAPFYSFIFHTTTGTAAPVYSVYPQAFGVNLVNDANPSTLAQYTPQLLASVLHGDVLMGHADYWQENDPTLAAIYSAAGVTAPSTPLTTPTITWPTPNSITYGSPLSAAQLDAVASVAGSYTYSPALGTVLPAGTQALTVNFTPANTSAYRATSATVQLTVGQVTPTITWPTPGGVAAGTALSAGQLNAVANVAGSFSYSPTTGTVLPAGNNTLTVTFTPADTTNYKTITTSTTLTVAGAVTPALNWPTPAAVPYGTALSGAQLNASSSVAGTFSYSPAAGTVPRAGSQTLTVTFTPNDTTAYKASSSTVQLNVTKANPVLSWPAPASVVAGTALSAAQLNASANVSGSFAYTPAVGTVVQAGNMPLSAVFTPADNVDYNTTTVSAVLNVTAAPATTPIINWSTPTAITYGTPLSAAQLNASASTAGAFTYSPALGTVLSAGTQQLTVTFTPANTAAYKVTSSAVRLMVNKIVPSVNWAPPGNITLGTALSDAQLNATASVPGTFVYSPAAGTTLPAGTTTLSATFTPTDATDYLASSVTTSLTVTAATTATSVSTTNLITDPGFELQTSNALGSPWTAIGNSHLGVDKNLGNAHSGVNNAYIFDVSSSWNAIQQTVTVQPNTEYVFSVWLRSSMVAPVGTVAVLGKTGALSKGAFGNLSQYTLQTVRFNSGANTSVTLQIGMQGQNTVQWVQIDDAALRTNLLLDPGFEGQAARSLASPWTQFGSGQMGVDNNLGNQHTGANNGWVWNNGSDFNAIAQIVAVQPNTNYVFTGWIRSSLAWQIGYFSVDGSNSILKETSFAGMPGYTQLTVFFNSGANTSVRVRAGFWGANTVQWMQADDFTLQQPQ